MNMGPILLLGYLKYCRGNECWLRVFRDIKICGMGSGKVILNVNKIKFIKKHLNWSSVDIYRRGHALLGGIDNLF